MPNKIDREDINVELMRKIGKDMSKILTTFHNSLNTIQKKYEDNPAEFSTALMISFSSLFASITDEPLGLCIQIANQVLQYKATPGEPLRDKPDYFG